MTPLFAFEQANMLQLVQSLIYGALTPAIISDEYHHARLHRADLAVQLMSGLAGDLELLRRL